MNILSAIKDENRFRPFLGEDLTSWQPWSVGVHARDDRSLRIMRRAYG
jgi:hypothetical protein